MAALSIILDGDGCWPDLLEKAAQGKLLDGYGGKGHISISALDGGMKSGEPSIAIRIDLPDGQVVIAEASMRHFLQAARSFEARYGDKIKD